MIWQSRDNPFLQNVPYQNTVPLQKEFVSLHTLENPGAYTLPGSSYLLKYISMLMYENSLGLGECGR